MISTRQGKRGVTEIYPKFVIKKSSDLMIRGGDFYAIWIAERGLDYPFSRSVSASIGLRF